jgi:hypothetical protein
LPSSALLHQAAAFRSIFRSLFCLPSFCLLIADLICYSRVIIRCFNPAFNTCSLRKCFLRQALGTSWSSLRSVSSAWQNPFETVFSTESCFLLALLVSSGTAEGPARRSSLYRRLFDRTREARNTCRLTRYRRQSWRHRDPGMSGVKHSNGRPHHITAICVCPSLLLGCYWSGAACQPPAHSLGQCLPFVLSSPRRGRPVDSARFHSARRSP